MKELEQKFNDLSSDSKVLFLLSSTNLIINNLSKSQGFDTALESIKNCWEWLNTKKICADDLYAYLENLDETGVLSFMSIEENPDKLKYWNCVGNAIAYTVHEAYNFENQYAVPQTIENVDYDSVDEFISNFNNCGSMLNVSELMEYLSSIDDLDISCKIHKTYIFLKDKHISFYDASI